MRKFEDLTHYEILQVPVNASSVEIQQAYRNELSIYGDESTIGHAFFSGKEHRKILERIEEAFSTLIHDDQREAYDQILLEKDIIDAASIAKGRRKVATALFSAKSPEGETVSKKIERIIQGKDLRAVLDELLSKETISGNDLRRLRAEAGIRVEDVFEVTRISVATLQAIESDLAEALPPRVYLRNFLKAYAALFKVDPIRIADGYLKNIDRINSP